MVIEKTRVVEINCAETETLRKCKIDTKEKPNKKVLNVFLDLIKNIVNENY